MSTYIGLERLRTAILNLFDWRGKVKQQTTAHLLPLLALVEHGVAVGTFAKFEEANDFEFFDRYMRVPGEDERPYFDPLTRTRRIASHPHSNVATLRKNTFANRWGAGQTREGPGGSNEWSLQPDFAETVRDQVLTKGGVTYRLNAVDLAVWLLRDETFPDNATTDELIARFKQRFPLTPAAFDTLFEYRPEPSASVFSATKPTDDAVTALVLELELRDASAPLPQPQVHAATDIEQSKLPADDPILGEVKALLALGTSGIILRGAPGTGKSWYADQIALAVASGKREHIFRLQFHPSFTYEDFFDGFVPDETTKSGFKVTGKTLRKALEKAQGTTETVVLLIDEINRGDTSRIFGEALTYIEQGWRGVEFTPKFGGAATSVPGNLLVLATMNPHDRSITQLDMALLRRFDHIDIPPSPEKVSDFLIEAGMAPAHAEEVKRWFLALQRLMPFGLGHTFFLNVGDVSRLGLMWRYRILPFCEAILEFEQEKLESVKKSFEGLEARLRGTAT